MKKILIVDDEEPILVLLSTIVNDSFPDVTILSAGDARKAIAAAKSEKPDIILLDNRMPGMSGIEACSLIKSDRELAQTKILMLSCQGQNFDWQKALAAGADAFITKPFDPTALIDKINELTKGNLNSK